MSLGFVRPTEIVGESINMHIVSRLVAWCNRVFLHWHCSTSWNKHIRNDIWTEITAHTFSFSCFVGLFPSFNIHISPSQSCWNCGLYQPLRHRGLAVAVRVLQATECWCSPQGLLCCHCISLMSQHITALQQLQQVSARLHGASATKTCTDPPPIPHKHTHHKQGQNRWMLGNTKCDSNQAVMYINEANI